MRATSNTTTRARQTPVTTEDLHGLAEADDADAGLQMLGSGPTNARGLQPALYSSGVIPWRLGYDVEVIAHKLQQTADRQADMEREREPLDDEDDTLPYYYWDLCARVHAATLHAQSFALCRVAAARPLRRGHNDAKTQAKACKRAALSLPPAGLTAACPRLLPPLACDRPEAAQERVRLAHEGLLQTSLTLTRSSGVLPAEHVFTSAPAPAAARAAARCHLLLRTANSPT